MENKTIFIAKVKDKIRNAGKGFWIATGCIGGFVILAIVCVIIAIYSSGSSLSQFFANNWGWFLMGFLVVVVLALTYMIYKIKKGK